MARPITENPAVFPLQSTPTRVLLVLLNASSRNVAIEFPILYLDHGTKAQIDG